MVESGAVDESEFGVASCLFDPFVPFHVSSASFPLL